jgi:small subunit ribosomal protein S3Ae
VLIRKVKVLKKPKFDLTKLMELYTTKTDAPAATTTAPADAQNLLSKQ